MSSVGGKRKLGEIRSDLGPDYAKNIDRIIKRTHPSCSSDNDLVEEDLFVDLFEMKGKDEVMKGKDEAMKEKDEAMKEKDEEIRKAKRNVELYSKNSLRRLWEGHAIPALKFRKDGSSIKSSYTSQHTDADVEQGVFEYLDINFERDVDINDTLDSTSSILLLSLDNYVYQGNSFSYSSEASLSAFVQSILLDIVKICGLEKEAIVRAEMSLTGKGGKRGRPDVWVVDIGGIPRLIVEVKSPTQDNMVDKPAVCGQLFDYLVAARSFAGSRAIGVITDVRDWKVCWLPSEYRLAATTTLESVLSTEDSDFQADSRVLQAKEKMKLHDSQLPKLLASVLIKSYRAPVQRLRLLSEIRRFIAYGAEQWTWGSLNKTRLRKKVSIQAPTDFIDQCFAISLFSAGVKRAFPAIDDATGKIYVVKIVYPPPETPETPENINSEVDCWRTIWGVNVPVGRLDSGAAMQLPLVYTCYTEPVSFRLSTPRLLFPSLSRANASIVTIESDDEALFDDIDAEYIAALEGWTPQEALRKAVDHMASLGYLHPDIEWRHVGMLPVFNDGKISSLRPILIDMECVQFVGKEPAQTQMYKRIEELEASSTFLGLPDCNGSTCRA